PAGLQSQSGLKAPNPQAGPAPTPSPQQPAQSGSGPMSWLHALVSSPVGQTAAHALSTVGDVIGRPYAAMSAWTMHHQLHPDEPSDLPHLAAAAGAMLNGSASPQDRDAATTAMTNTMAQGTPLENAPPWVKNLVVGTVMDPTTLASGPIG